MGEQKVRISDIAEELGLSTATVSNVIHGKTNKISEETQKRVMQLLEERQYIPSMAGILLAQNTSKIIGVFINDHEKYEGHTLEDFFIASALNDLSTEIEASGQFMMIKKTKSVADIIKFASMWNMDGIVVIGFCEQDYQYLRDHMRIPFVIYDGCCDNYERIVNITIDNFDGGHQAGTWLREHGHKNALCISDNDICVDKERMEGFRAGFTPGNVTFIEIPMLRERRWAFYQKKIEEIRSVSAVFAVSDYYAIDLLRFLKKQEIQVPEEIAIIGFDDIPLCEMVSPTLSTVRQDRALRAKIAIEQLHELKNEKHISKEIKLPVELVIRDSTGW